MSTSTNNTKKETLQNQNTKDLKEKKPFNLEEWADKNQKMRIAALNNLANHDKSN